MNSSLVVNYGTPSAMSRWIARFWMRRDRSWVLWLLTLFLATLLAFGPQMLLWLVSFLPLDQLGNSGASAGAHQTLLLVAAILCGVFMVPIVRSLVRPVCLKFTDDGLREIWLVGVFRIRRRFIPWLSITQINVVKPRGVTDLKSYHLRFSTKDSPAAVNLTVGKLEEGEARRAMSDVIACKARNARIAPDVFDVLTPKTNLSFTELWLDALSAPPGRDRLLPLAAGVLLDSRYRIVKRLGAGGQGTVYLAGDIHSNSDVVLKEAILPVYADLVARKQALEDFHKEALALESVKHPSIVRFITSFVADHRAYLVLDYIQGTTLSEHIASRGVLTSTDAVSLGMQLCDILSVLHNREKPLIHRDFTPDNLMLTESGAPMLIDFAVAVSTDADTENVAGKSAYMAPEQFKGRPGVQSDIYALGCTLHYCLTGEDPEPLTECMPILVNDNVPKALSDLVARATKYESAQRFATAHEVKMALEAL